MSVPVTDSHPYMLTLHRDLPMSTLVTDSDPFITFSLASGLNAQLMIDPESKHWGNVRDP
jgi:hypothetical protein